MVGPRCPATRSRKGGRCNRRVGNALAIGHGIRDRLTYAFNIPCVESVGRVLLPTCTQHLPAWVASDWLRAVREIGVSAVGPIYRPANFGALVRQFGGKPFAWHASETIVVSRIAATLNKYAREPWVDWANPQLVAYSCELNLHTDTGSPVQAIVVTPDELAIVRDQLLEAPPADHGWARQMLAVQFRDRLRWNMDRAATDYRPRMTWVTPAACRWYAGCRGFSSRTPVGRMDVRTRFSFECDDRLFRMDVAKRRELFPGVEPEDHPSPSPRVLSIVRPRVPGGAS